MITNEGITFKDSWGNTKKALEFQTIWEGKDKRIHMPESSIPYGRWCRIYFSTLIYINNGPVPSAYQESQFIDFRIPTEFAEYQNQILASKFVHSYGFDRSVSNEHMPVDFMFIYNSDSIQLMPWIIKTTAAGPCIFEISELIEPWMFRLQLIKNL